MMAVKNIIFDLGNVILDIDTHRSKEAFAVYGLKDFEKLYSLALQSELFDRLEIGIINEIEFYSEFRNLTKTKLGDKTIKDCWNALIIDYTQKRLDFLLEISSRVKIFLLSNTNIIHYKYYTNLLQEKYKIKDLESIFHKTYFSHECGLKKPDSEFFNLVLNQNELNPQETLFVDDCDMHIKAASKLGLSVVLLSDCKLENVMNNIRSMIELK